MALWGSDPVLTNKAWFLHNTKGARLAVLAFVAGWVLYVLSHYVCKALLPSYRKLSATKQVEWNSRVVSNINAIVVTYGALKVLFTTNVYDKYPLTTWSDEGGIYIQILLGYFVYDTLLVLLNKELRTPSTLAHHIMGLISYTLVYSTGQAQHVAMLWMSTEWFMAETKRSDTTLYLVNGIVMTLAFLVWRVLYVPGTAIYTLYKFRDQFSLVLPILKPAIPIFIGGVTILNVYWTGLMIKGILRKLPGKPNAPEKSQKGQKHQQPEKDDETEDIDGADSKNKDLKERKKKNPIGTIKSMVAKMKPKQAPKTKPEKVK